EPIGIGKRLPVEPEIIILPDLAELRIGRDRDYCPARHGGSSSAGNASPRVAQSREDYSAPLNLYHTPSAPCRVSGAPAANSRGLRSTPPASGLPHEGAL